jgi:hypothetical protein
VDDAPLRLGEEGTVTMAKVISITWDEAAVRAECASPTSGIGRALETLAGHLQSEMKRRCPVSPHGRSESGGGRWPARSSGTLRSSIEKFRQPDGSWLVGPTDKTASGEFLGPMLERGTPPHSIDSTGPWPLRNPDSGQVFGPHVDHPGTRAQPFIVPAAEAMHGYQVNA